MKRLQKWSLTLLATATLVTVVLLLTGWGSAAAAQLQSVFVTNTSSNPVPVAQQVATQHKRFTLEYSNAEDDETFPAIHASLITLTGDGFGNLDWVYLKSGGNVVLFLPLQPTETVVLPFPQLLTVDEVVLGNCFGSTTCFADVNIIGS